MTRPLTLEETSLITKIAERLGDVEGRKLTADMQNARAQALADDGSRIVFEIAGYERPPYRGQHPFGVEGKMLDDDGTELSVLLHADENGRLLELEFIRWGPGPLISPNWPTLKLH